MTCVAINPPLLKFWISLFLFSEKSSIVIVSVVPTSFSILLTFPLRAQIAGIVILYEFEF